MTTESDLFLAANPNVVVVFKMGVEAQICVCPLNLVSCAFLQGFWFLHSFMLL